jgi:hypothetical protein
MPILPANSHSLLNGCEPHTRGWQSSSVHRPAVIVDERGAVQRSNSNCTFSIQINNLPFDKALTVHHDLGFSPGDFSEFSGQAMPTTTYSESRQHHQVRHARRRLALRSPRPQTER